MKDKFKRNPGHRARMRLISGRLRERRKRVADLRRNVFLVPATITSLGLLVGFYSVLSTIHQRFIVSAVMIMVAFVCDGLDGRVARASHTSSRFGIEYDSIADVVAFGVAPSLLAYNWALRPLGVFGAMAAGIFVVCAALRLARFNVQADVVDKRRFVGLPVPGAAMVIAGMVLADRTLRIELPLAVRIAAMLLIVALAGLMISHVPYPSFKAIDWRRRGPLKILVPTLVTIAFLVAIPQLTPFLLALAYLLSGPVLMACGERISPKAPAMRPISAEPNAGPRRSVSDHPETPRIPPRA
jgi:CDP-diacylglycerol---serine O-phosphatidyltransferase